MTIPKKGSRPIVVDGQKYRWRVRQKPTYSQGNAWGNLSVSVERFTEPGAALIIDMGKPRLDAWLGMHPSAGVVPSEIAQAIREAFAIGWQPAVPGKPFLLEKHGAPGQSTAPDAP